MIVIGRYYGIRGGLPVNTIPGFTEISQFPMLWAASGLSNAALLDRLIELALKRHQVKKSLKRSL